VTHGFNWAQISIGCLGIALATGCVDPFQSAPARPKLTWHGAEMLVQDSTQDSDGRKSFEFKNGEPHPELTCRVTLYPSEWHAQSAWQALPGNRTVLPGSVLSAGGYALVGGNQLIQCRSLGGGLLSHENWSESFRWAGLPVQREPGFSQLFLQQHRIDFSGFALPSNYLGLPWSPPLYGMQYQYLQDTLQAILAGPQDSLFSTRHRKTLGLTLPGNSQEYEGIQFQISSNGIKRWWKWGREGWIGLEGCSKTPKCSLWVEKQYEVLQIFGRDGFFSLKNAI
jgi:hypothetical protein